MTTDTARKAIETAQANLEKISQGSDLSNFEQAVKDAQAQLNDAKSKFAGVLAHKLSLQKTLEQIKVFEDRKATDIPSNLAYSVIALSNVPVDQLPGI